MKSQYPSKNGGCFSCGSTWKIGDEIYKKTSQNGKGYWCANPNCPNDEPQTVMRTPEEVKQDTLATLEDLEKAELNTKDFNDGIIDKQIALIEKIESRVKDNLVKKQGQNYSVQQLGLWVKLIYQNMSS